MKVRKVASEIFVRPSRADMGHGLECTIHCCLERVER